MPFAADSTACTACRSGCDGRVAFAAAAVTTVVVELSVGFEGGEDDRVHHQPAALVAGDRREPRRRNHDERAVRVTRIGAERREHAEPAVGCDRLRVPAIVESELQCLRGVGEIGGRRRRRRTIHHDEPERIVTRVGPARVEIRESLLEPAAIGQPLRRYLRVESIAEHVARGFTLSCIPASGDLRRHSEQIAELEVRRIDASLTRATRARDSDA